jgi:hypothetical protein
LLTYPEIGRQKMRLLINFNMAKREDGIQPAVCLTPLRSSCPSWYPSGAERTRRPMVAGRDSQRLTRPPRDPKRSAARTWTPEEVTTKDDASPTQDPNCACSGGNPRRPQP